MVCTPAAPGAPRCPPALGPTWQKVATAGWYRLVTLTLTTSNRCKITISCLHIDVVVWNQNEQVLATQWVKISMPHHHHELTYRRGRRS